MVQHEPVRLRRSQRQPDHQLSAAERQERAAEVQARLAASPPHVRLLLARTLITALVLAIASPVELAVPVVRALLGRRGVQTGPAVGSLLAFGAGLVFVGRPADEESDDAGPSSRIDRALDRALISSAVVLPSLGALLPFTVVARRRSALWGLPLWVLVRLAAVFVLAEAADRAKKKAGEEGPAADDAAPVRP